jgi:putative SOS response-associated peptidase YedK
MSAAPQTTVGIIAPNYNVAPGDFHPVIRRSNETNERELVMMRWGIVPWFELSPLGERSFVPTGILPPR